MPIGLASSLVDRADASVESWMSPRAERSENKPEEVTFKVLHGRTIAACTNIESSVRRLHRQEI